MLFPLRFDLGPVGTLCKVHVGVLQNFKSIQRFKAADGRSAGKRRAVVGDVQEHQNQRA